MIRDLRLGFVLWNNTCEIRKEHRIAEELEAHIHSDTELKQLDPLHAYVYADNRMDVMAEQLMKLPACGKMVSAMRDAYNRYTPEFPPISPVADSYFSCWATLDLEVSPGKDIKSHDQGYYQWFR